jgi:hypothetical protein
LRRRLLAAARRRSAWRNAVGAYGFLAQAHISHAVAGEVTSLARGWLDVYCPGCGTIRALDIRTIDRHPLASVGSLVLGLRCSWCPGSAPMPKIVGLHALPPAASV